MYDFKDGSMALAEQERQAPAADSSSWLPDWLAAWVSPGFVERYDLQPVDVAYLVSSVTADEILNLKLSEADLALLAKLKECRCEDCWHHSALRTPMLDGSAIVEHYCHKVRQDDREPGQVHYCRRFDPVDPDYYQLAG